jgi:hypothetical protein
LTQRKGCVQIADCRGLPLPAATPLRRAQIGKGFADTEDKAQPVGVEVGEVEKRGM